MRSRIVIVVTALVLAVMSVWGFLSYAAGADARAVAGQQVARMYVTTDIVPRATSLAAAIDSGAIVQTTVVASAKPLGALEDVTDANRSWIALEEVPAGQVVLAGNFAESLPDVGPLEVPSGLIAVSVELGDPERVGTFVAPGASIAVFATVGGQAQGGGRTALLLPRVLVLGVGASIVPPEEGSEPSALVTLAVTQAQAERLIHAVRTGSIYMALLDNTTTLTPGAGVNDGSLFAN